MLDIFDIAPLYVRMLGDMGHKGKGRDQYR